MGGKKQRCSAICLYPEVPQDLRVGHCVFLAAVVLIVMSAVVLVGLGATVVRDRLHVTSFTETTCSGGEVSEVGERECDCGEDCRSSYPCLEVFITYLTTDNSSVSDVILYQSESEIGDDCSLSPCRAEEDDNKKKVEEFVQKYTSNGTISFKCFYNAEDHSEVILEDEGNVSVLHYVLWPALVISFGILMAIGSSGDFKRAAAESSRLYNENDDCRKVNRYKNAVTPAENETESGDGSGGGGGHGGGGNGGGEGSANQGFDRQHIEQNIYSSEVKDVFYYEQERATMN